MSSYSNVAVASGKELPRNTIFKIINIAFQKNETKFARHLAYYWLDFYPGDLDMQYVVAKSFLLENNHKKAHPLLSQILYKDPTHLDAINETIAVCKQYDYPNGMIYEGLKYIVSESANGSVDAWAETSKKAYEFFKNNDKATAIALIQSVLNESIATPLPAIFHLMFAENELSDLAYFNLLTLYSKRWSDAVAIQYLDANYKLNHGQESQGVALLHQCVQDDISGKIASFVWGKDHPFASLWDETPSVALNMQLPASVAAALGWNQLAAGAYDEINDVSDSEAQEIALEVEEKPQAVKAEPAQAKSDGPTIIARDATTFKRLDNKEVKNEVEQVTEAINKPGLSDDSFRNPIYLILSSKKALVNKYGEMNFEKIRSELENLAILTGKYHNWKAKIVFVDDMVSVNQFGLEAVDASDAWAIKTLIADIDNRLAESNYVVSALLIVGGHDVIPFHFLPNPVPDSDTDVYTDAPYATLDENYFIPTISAGRMPGDDSNDPSLLLTMIRNAQLHRQNQIQTKGKLEQLFSKFMNLFGVKKPTDVTFGATTEIWKKASQAVYKTFSKTSSMVSTPPTNLDDFPMDHLNAARFAHFNIHGAKSNAIWYGEKDPSAKFGDQYVAFFGPHKVPDNVPAIVFSEACYGANLISHNAETSMALKFLSKGTNAFIGSTCISYGGFSTPLTGADLLAQVYWKMMLNGYSAGDALRRAKITMVREAHRDMGHMDNEDQKTIISFNLFGDPLTSYNAAGSSSKYIVRETVAKDVMCTASNDLVEKTMPNQNEIPDEVLNNVKKAVKAYLPGFKGARVEYNPIMIQKNAYVTKIKCEGDQCELYLSDYNTISLSREVVDNAVVHKNFAHLTLDKNNKVVKIITSK